jgi:hypothetical protein
MRGKTIRIASLGAPSDYRTSLVPLIIQGLGYKLQWVGPISADLIIYGPFYDVNASRLRWLPRSWRNAASTYLDAVEKKLAKRQYAPVTLFHTAENLRHDHIKADYAISYDLNVSSENHFRLPYWMEMIDWSHEGIVGNTNPRYGELLELERLQAPLGSQFLKRSQKAMLITSHLREPRASCYFALQEVMPVDGMGPYFDKSIKNHHKSHFVKKNILENYAFNLCPENGMFPGYVTEKIPEAFAAGCLPITFVDESVSKDFNPNAMINMATLDPDSFEELENVLNENLMKAIAQEPLLLQRPSLQGLKVFLKAIANDAV